MNSEPHHHRTSRPRGESIDVTEQSEQKVNKVFILTTATMFLEIAAGAIFGSMALLADGWHMFTHSAAFAITLFAYAYARKHKDNPAFAFGTGKVSALGGFASAVALAVVALFMIMESLERLVVPHDIQFNEAIGVAIIGLAVNLASVFLLHDHSHSHSHSHPHDHSNAHSHEHNHAHHHTHDHNLKAAYFHVLADTLTSILAIIALLAGKHMGWIWLDAVMGIVGAVVIARWAFNLVKESSGALLDRTPSNELFADIRERIAENQGDNLIDLRLWQITTNQTVAILYIQSETQTDPNFYKNLLSDLKLSHITVELHVSQPTPERIP